MNFVKNPKLGRIFFERDPLIVSKELLGKLIIRRGKRGRIVGEIVETEAYVGPDDKASHACGNKRTKRTYVQFGERGHAYVFRIYGIYCCFCVVVGAPYVPAVTLIRAVKPIEGIELMCKNRNLDDDVSIQKLANGPSKFCQAFGITDRFNGIDLLGEELFLCYGQESSFEIEESARIGIDYAEEYRYVPWRFCRKSSEFVTKSRDYNST